MVTHKVRFKTDSGSIVEARIHSSERITEGQRCLALVAEEYSSFYVEGTVLEII